MAKQDLKALIPDLNVVESRISVCKAFETSHRYISIQSFVWVFMFLVAFTVEGPI